MTILDTILTVVALFTIHENAPTILTASNLT